MNIKELVKDKIASFTYYRAGNLWYTIGGEFEFPVPIEDTGEASFPDHDKAIYFMRYIRKHLEVVKQESKEGKEAINATAH